MIAYLIENKKKQKVTLECPKIPAVSMMSRCFTEKNASLLQLRLRSAVIKGFGQALRRLLQIKIRRDGAITQCLYLYLAVMSLTLPLTARADVQEIPCIDDITGGTTEDFESLYGTPVNDVLVNHDMTAVPDKISTTFVSWVVGNDCAPISSQAGFGDDFRIETTGEPWDAIGFSVVGTLLNEDRTFNLYAYDQDGELLGSIQKVFDAGDGQDSYNEGAVFVGLSSTDTPIYSVRMTSDNPNVGWDNITYRHWSEPANTLTISPASGSLIIPQRFDLALIAKTGGLSVAGITSADVDGVNALWYFRSRAVPGLLASGAGETLRYKSFKGFLDRKGLLVPGQHTLNVALRLSDGSTLSNSATWNIEDVIE